MGLELRHFQLVAAVADTGSLAAASQRLNLSSSALSHQLKDAEERLGVRLFQRRHRRLLLTGAGEKLVGSARQVLADVARAEAGCRGDAPEDLLRVSTGCYTTYGWLARILERFQAEHPRVELRVVLEATRRAVPALLAGELDLALATDGPRHPRLRRSPLVDDELLLVVPASHALARRGHVEPRDLAHEHLLTYDAPREQLDIFTRVLWPAGVEPRRVSRVPLTEALLDLVRAGLGVAPLADWVVPTRAAGLRAVRLTARGVKRRWSAVTLAGRRPSPAPGRLVELLREGLASGATAATAVTSAARSRPG
jgi:LysR family transcriptional regulator for metE and metH